MCVRHDTTSPTMAAVVDTGFGPVEVAHHPGDGAAILFFAGGHCDAATPAGADLYTELGYEVLSFSRPGYGSTDVGPLSAAEFVPAVGECCDTLGITNVAAVVGVSFGGLQALHVAASTDLAPRLVLHSCAPSTLPFPDTRRDRAAVPLAFGPVTGRATWAVIRSLVASDKGLRCMMGSLSTLPVDVWWDEWTDDDKASARRTFYSMASGTGFVNDVRQAGPDLAHYRRMAQRSVPCPTLVTASRHDCGVAFAHAEDLALTIPHTTLAETYAPSHFFWIGAARRRTLEAVTTHLMDDRRT